ncbi:MAG TPA: helix-turn-helix domain-containing protein [Rhizomicrobium sp.]|jgi:AraC-like DNA-binding protein
MLSYSTHGLPSSAKVSYWNDIISDVFAPLETKPTNAQAFDAEVRCLHVGRLRMAQATSRAATVKRSKAQAAKVDDHRFFLHVQIGGQLLVKQESHEALLQQGDLVLSDSTLPYQLTYDDSCSTLVLIVAEHELKRHLPTPEEMIGVKMSGAKGLSQTTSLMLRNVWEQAENLPPELGSRIADSILDVFATACTEIKGMVVADAAIVGARRIQIKRYIEANLRDPELSVRSVAAAFGISPRYLHILFASEQETVSTYVLRRRLEECGKQLADALWQRRTITEIAFGWGFNNATHFARVFRNHYGTSPREYRNTHAKTVVRDKWLAREHAG